MIVSINTATTMMIVVIMIIMIIIRGPRPAAEGRYVHTYVRYVRTYVHTYIHTWTIYICIYIYIYIYVHNSYVDRDGLDKDEKPSPPDALLMTRPTRNPTTGEVEGDCGTLMRSYVKVV